MSIYAQQGYGKGTKIENGFNDDIIQGVILSPKNEKVDKMKEYIDFLHTNYPDKEVLFDPQFYISTFGGDVNEGKLPQYPYYESNISISELSNPSKLASYVKRVIDYERSLSIAKIISPSICVNDFNGKLGQIAISLAYEAVNNSQKEDLLITLCIKETAFSNTDAMKEFLDIISLLDVKGFYIIVDRLNTDKLSDISTDNLCNIMYFCYTLATINEFEVVVGYTDMLSIPLAITGVNSTACGWYNNLKGFSEASFHPSSGGRRPRKRYTSYPLINSILIIPELQFINASGRINSVLSNTKFDQYVYPVVDDSSWSDEISCLHNWNVLTNAIDDIEKIHKLSDKAQYVKSLIDKAQQLYKVFVNVPFDSKSNDIHLSKWSDAIDQFINEIGV